jgi:hypothetical protein
MERRAHRPCKAGRLSVAWGEAQVWQPVSRTAAHDGPIPLARARGQDGPEEWVVVSEEPTDVQTCKAYGVRCDSEDNVWDDQAPGVPLESSLIRAAKAWERLCLVWAITTLSLVVQGVEVVSQGKRRGGNPHGLRGRSSLKSGWNGVKLALSKGYELMIRWYLAADADPQPARASTRQAQKPPRLFLALACHDAVA